MFSLIYIEKDIATHPQVQRLCHRFSSHQTVLIDHYMEVFNRRAQNFRIQKRMPALILAQKHQNFLLKTPVGYGIGTDENYYFSHLLNCPYDCRYCFLQGMYQSAHFVFFVNQDAFQTAVQHADGKNVTFFSGYDCDSLAFESVTGFAKEWLPLIRSLEGIFEFRTKSTMIRPFLEYPALKNCVVAYTLTPHEIGAQYEHRTPSLEKRLQAIEKLQNRGWQIGLRFDPILSLPNATEIYQTFFREVFTRVDLSLLHSVSLGGFRMPHAVLKKMISLYPKEVLFAKQHASEEKLLGFCEQEVLKYTLRTRIFSCV